MFIIKVSKKIKVIVSLIACTVAMLCSALPSFAFDYYNFTDNSGITDSEYDSLLQSLLDQELYLENNFVMLRAVNSDGLIIVSILSFNLDYDWKLYIDNEGYYAVHLASDGDYVYRPNLYFYVFDTSSRTFSYYLGSLPDKLKAESNPYFSNCDIFRQGDYKNPIYHENTIVQDPNAPVPAPFTVTYSPELKLNLKRKTSDYETKSIDVTLTLNKDYLDWYIRRYAELLMDITCGSCDDEDISAILNTELLSSQMDFTDCAKSRCIYFISLSDTSKSLKKVTENSVYTYLSQQKYSIVGKDNGEIDGNTSTAVYANGLYPYFTVDFNDDFKSLGCTSNVTYSEYQNLISDLPSYTFSVPLKNINADKFEVISVLNSILTSETQFNFNKNIVAEGQNQGTFSQTFTEKYNVNTGSNGVSFNNDDNWQNDTLSYADYFNKSDIYNVYSSQFSFDSYPKYVPLKDGQGNDIDMLKSNPFDYSMNPVLPGTYQSVGQDGKFSDERTAEQQKKYDEEVKKAQNFADVDFGIDGIKSIFDRTSDFYAFLTASIAILPNYFLIILGSFFAIMLAICVVKWLL